MLDSQVPKPFGPEDFRGVAVSPDGKFVLGYKDRAAWIIPISGSEPGRQIGVVTPKEFASGWTADSQGVYVESSDTIPAKIDVLDIKTGQRKFFKEYSPADPSGVPGLGGASVTPDGRFMAFGVARTLSYLYVVEGLK